MEWIGDPNAWLGLLTLTALEVVLGIDNIIFISILASKLPAAEQPRARRLGLMGALFSRLILLFSLAWIIGLTQPLIEILGRGISGRDIILVLGGLFLIGKATYEIHQKLEAESHQHAVGGDIARSMARVVAQIMVIDIVFSLDSVITAVGMVDHVAIMVAANLVALGVMLASIDAIAGFVERHPSVKLLALSFLLLIGANLVAEGFGAHIPKGYTYFAMGFAVFVEMLNLRLGRKQAPVELRQPLDYSNVVDRAAGN